MAKQQTTKTTESVVEEKGSLEAIAQALESLAVEAEGLDDRLAKHCRTGAKRARWVEKQHASQAKRAGGLIKSLQAQGLSAEEIVARLTGDNGK